MSGTIHLELVMSGLSLLVTCYFWLVRANQERPNLQFHQISDFRAVCRTLPDRPGLKRLCVQQIDTGGVLVVNHSTRQNSIILFECQLLTDRGAIPGDWGFAGDDKPPWNIGPESSLGISPACFFDVPEDFELPENPEFELQFLTASGKPFRQRFAKLTPRLGGAESTLRKAG